MLGIDDDSAGTQFFFSRNWLRLDQVLFGARLTCDFRFFFVLMWSIHLP